MKEPGVPETGHNWQARTRAEETLSYEGRADCLDHAKEHARDVLALEAECERLQERLDVRLDEDSVYRIYDETHERALAAEAECERLRAGLHNCRDDYHRKVIALQAEIAALKKENRGCV